jgi:hypothetical protein
MPFAPPPLLAPPRRLSRLAAIVLLSTITLAAGSLVAASGRAAATARRTEVVQWSPFDARGAIKRSFAVRTVAAVGGCGDIGPGSEALGDYGYRCGFANYIVDPCWRDGPGRTEHVICAADPWTRSVESIRVPKLMLRVGVTFAGAPGPVWAIELTNGDRCMIAQGAHSTVTGRGTGLVVDYYCKSGIVLLRNLRRGTVWRMAPRALTVAAAVIGFWATSAFGARSTAACRGRCGARTSSLVERRHSRLRSFAATPRRGGRRWTPILFE